MQNSSSWLVLGLVPAESRRSRSGSRPLGLLLKRHLVRMARGKDLREKENAIYAIAGFELG